MPFPRLSDNRVEGAGLIAFSTEDNEKTNELSYNKLEDVQVGSICTDLDPSSFHKPDELCYANARCLSYFQQMHQRAEDHQLAEG